MTSGQRTPTWNERENNRRRERLRRAIAAKIFAGLRAYGNFNLPKHCDNNEVLKALAREAGWIVESDGTTYRKGCKPEEQVEPVIMSVSPSPCSSYQPSPYASYNPSPTSSSYPSPTRTPYLPTNLQQTTLDVKNLSKRNHIFIQQGGSISAPVTPPLSSPGTRSPRRIKADHDSPSLLPGFCIVPNGGGPTSPTFNLVSQNPFNPFGSFRMWTPGQSGTCSPLARDDDARADDGVCDEFAFGSSSNDDTVMVKAWEGERIHEECGTDELELTLGISGSR